MDQIPNPSRRSPWLLRLAAGVALALGGAVLAHFSMATHPRFLHLPDAVDSQRAILERRIFTFDGFVIDFPSWRNRVLVPLAMKAIATVSPASPSQAYLAVRWLSACAALLAFSWLVHVVTRADAWFCGLAALGLSICLFPTFLHIYEIPSDFLDAAFFSVLLVCVVRGQRWLLAIAMLVGLLNRESAIFALIAWWAVHAFPFERRTFIRESVFCAVLGVAGAALVMGLRVANAITPALATKGLQPFTPWEMVSIHWDQIREFLRSPNYGNPLFFLFAYLVFVGLVAAACWAELPATLRRLGWTAAGLYAISIPYGNLDELRINIPALVICTLLLAHLTLRRVQPPVRP